MDIYMALKAFVRTVEKGSVTGAAQALSISQPAVSKHLQNLERHLNARLLERSPRRLQVTAHGIALYESSRTSILSIDSALEGVRLRAGEIEGLLRVHAPSSFGVFHLHDLLMKFQQDHPGIEVELVLDDRQVDLVDERYDIAISYGKITSLDTIVRRVGWVRFILVASPAFIQGVGGIDTPDRLAQLSVVCANDFATENGTVRLHRRDHNPIDVGIYSGLRTNSSQVLISSLLADCGIGVVQLNLVSRELADGSLKQVLPDYSIKPAELLLTFPSTKFMRPVVRAFADFLVPKLKEIDGIVSRPD